MKVNDNTPETVFTVLLKFSIFYLLCMAILNAPHVNGQTINFQRPKRAINLTQERVQQIYTSQIGVREKPSNSGRAVEQYLRYVNLPKGNPWCAAFVCWVFGEANISNPRTGWSPAMFPASRVIWEQGAKIKEQGRPPSFAMLRRAKQNSIALDNYSGSGVRMLIVPARKLLTGNRQPAAGDIFALYFPEKGRIAHTGFIDQWDDTWLITVEGNTNVSGSREGDGVYRKRRLVRSVYKVARYVK